MATQTHSTSTPSVRSSSGEQMRSAVLDDTPRVLSEQPAGMTVGQTDEETSASPAYHLSGQTSLPARLARALNRLMFNLFPFVVVAAFFWLQVQIDTQNTGLLHTLVIIMSVLVELGMIFVWSLFIR